MTYIIKNDIKLGYYIVPEFRSKHGKQTNMENTFKFSQSEFIKSQHTDRNIYNGLCFFMCIDYIYNKSNNIKCDFIFFSKTYAFSSRYRGMLFAYESGAIKDPYLIKNGKIHLKK